MPGWNYCQVARFGIVVEVARLELLPCCQVGAARLAPGPVMWCCVGNLPSLFKGIVCRDAMMRDRISLMDRKKRALSFPKQSLIVGVLTVLY